MLTCFPFFGGDPRPRPTQAFYLFWNVQKIEWGTGGVSAKCAKGAKLVFNTEDAEGTELVWTPEFFSTEGSTDAKSFEDEDENENDDE